MTPRNRLAGAIEGRASRSVQQGQTRFYARVLRINPLQIELHDRRVTISEENIVVTQWVRKYDYDHALGIGDTVVVDRMPNGDFLVSDVVSTGKAETGDGALATSGDPTWSGVAPAGGGAMTVTASHHIVKKVERLDESGNVIGYVPIYGTLP